MKRAKLFYAVAAAIVFTFSTGGPILAGGFHGGGFGGGFHGGGFGGGFHGGGFGGGFHGGGFGGGFHPSMGGYSGGFHPSMGGFHVPSSGIHPGNLPFGSGSVIHRDFNPPAGFQRPSIPANLPRSLPNFAGRPGGLRPGGEGIGQRIGPQHSTGPDWAHWKNINPSGIHGSVAHRPDISSYTAARVRNNFNEHHGGPDFMSKNWFDHHPGAWSPGGGGQGPHPGDGLGPHPGGGGGDHPGPGPGPGPHPGPPGPPGPGPHPGPPGPPGPGPHPGPPGPPGPGPHPGPPGPPGPGPHPGPPGPPGPGPGPWGPPPPGWWGGCPSWGYCWGWFGAGFFGGMLADDILAPYPYDYGSNIVYEGDTVYVNDVPYCGADEYYQQAQDIANAGSEDTVDRTVVSLPEGVTAATPPMPSKTDEKSAPTAEDGWLPMGTFAVIADNSQKESQRTLQLATNKQGLIRGNLINQETDKATELYGSVDPKTQRVAFKVRGYDDIVAECGLWNLTQDKVPMLIHYGKNRTEERTLIRVDNPKPQEPATPKTDAAKPIM